MNLAGAEKLKKIEKEIDKRKRREKELKGEEKHQNG